MKTQEKGNTLQKELTDLAKYITGEADLRARQEKVEKMKVEAVKKQKDIRRKEIVEQTVVLEKDDVTNKKVVQKLSLFDWDAPIRFKFPLDMKSYMVTVGLCMIFVIYLAVLGHYGLMATLIALLFYVYVAGTVSPIQVKHSITTRGIETMDRLYEWFMLDDFWFTKKDDEYMLSVNTKLRMPARLLMILDKKDVPTIFVLLQDKLLYRDVKKQGFIEKKSYGDYIPLESI